eukprot:TRINITY_DN92270_c0_g1_i1.p1 TRINITY_DN92270_c0_g1~~TRINITY_DN92270_c0_g1_i1.p1  ORF type:complete len:136 (-),score=4.02 TRINITY_DN92270_c0_g1_i1:70-417(-)
MTFICLLLSLWTYSSYGDHFFKKLLAFLLILLSTLLGSIFNVIPASLFVYMTGVLGIVVAISMAFFSFYVGHVISLRAQHLLLGLALLLPFVSSFFSFFSGWEWIYRYGVVISVA